MGRSGQFTYEQGHGSQPSKSVCNMISFLCISFIVIYECVQLCRPFSFVAGWWSWKCTTVGRSLARLNDVNWTELTLQCQQAISDRVFF